MIQIIGPSGPKSPGSRLIRTAAVGFECLKSNCESCCDEINLLSITLQDLMFAIMRSKLWRAFQFQLPDLRRPTCEITYSRQLSESVTSVGLCNRKNNQSQLKKKIRDVRSVKEEKIRKHPTGAKTFGLNVIGNYVYQGLVSKIFCNFDLFRIIDAAVGVI